MGTSFTPSMRSAVLAVTVSVVFGVSCDNSNGGSQKTAAASASSVPSRPPDTADSPTPARTSASADASIAPSSAILKVKVRDAFAGLQATLKDTCTPSNCAYFLGRVHDELHRLDRAMKTDPKGAGHFPEPIALIKALDAELGGDRSFENLNKHQTTLLRTRDRINSWMQGHPDDYR
ncbi:hypothetical protein B4N89_45645 [Embleya scabrispora]|uniref:Uncharacterized protein n=1 Tax=Embleya scabrispora TaxID=159449 RepID=A0A1T3NJ95_9ACTN|nr:hypothetical protein [Embleya scabrispora]OPC76765.1 hypothetical protein B4N89_45645 [Embleya scabrispora]